MKKPIVLAIIAMLIVTMCAGCEDTATRQNIADTKATTETLVANQKTPTDIDFSLERYNLIKRAYWVNGQSEKAASVPCPVNRPIGYIVCFSGSAVVRVSTVDGKLTSLNSYLSPDSEYYSCSSSSHWLADVDGSYGTNVDGIFWFDVDGHYYEWTGDYLYSDVPFEVDTPIVHVKN